MPNGVWKITSKPPERPGARTGLEYLPDGTRIRLLFQGASRGAVEMARSDELVVHAAIASPVTPALCRTGLGKVSDFGDNVCDEDGNPLQLKEGQRAEFEGAAVFARVVGGPDAPYQEDFFVQQGARPGAALVSITFKEKGLVWDLWLKSQDVMVSRAFLKGPTAQDIEEFPLVWTREH